MGHESNRICDNLLVWIDLEMTGLDVEQNRIIEMATIVTDSELNIIAEGPELVINQPKERLDEMDDWNTNHHTASGLIERVRESVISEEEAEMLTLEFLSGVCLDGDVPLCGNTIRQDRLFLARWMPKLHSWFHYRSIDVSTVKELVRRWYPSLPMMQKGSNHRALEDIKESIAELQYYRNKVFAEPMEIDSR